MKVKILASIILLVTLAATRVHSLGFGVQFNLIADDVFASKVAFTLSPTRMIHLAANWYVNENKGTTMVAISADRTLLTIPIYKFNPPMENAFNFNVGAGLFVNATFGGDDFVFNGGLRLPLGINFLMLKNVFEIYTHVAPSLGFLFVPKFGLANPFYPVAIGAKFWVR